jgi:hypothetical protein
LWLSRARIFLFDYLPVAGDNFESAIVSSQWNVESDNRLASLDQVKPLLVDSGLGSAGFEEKLDLLEETGLAVGVKSFACLYCSSGECRSLED